MRNKGLYILSIALLVAACSGQEGVEKKKSQLNELKSKVKELNGQIAQLEKEIASEDPDFNNAHEGKAILVATEAVMKEDFIHKIEVRGSVDSKKNVLVSAQIGGEIEAIRVKEGQKVNKGDVLIMLDADVIQNNIAELKTDLDLANAVYKRQSNLWKKDIGTEIQYLEAKNKKESLERKLATAKSQLDQAIIRAPFSGSVDEIPAKEGEMASPGAPLVRMVSERSMFIQADVSERYIGDLNVGDEVSLYFPVQDKRFNTTISFVSEVINSANRTFSIEVQLPQLDFKVKPNQVVIMEMADYKAENAIVVPTEVILSDNDGKFLYTASSNKAESVAKKTHIQAGKTYKGKTEILSGLAQNDLIITEGYRDVSDGVLIKSTKRSTESTETAKL